MFIIYSSHSGGPLCSFLWPLMKAVLYTFHYTASFLPGRFLDNCPPNCQWRWGSRVIFSDIPLHNVCARLCVCAYTFPYAIHKPFFHFYFENNRFKSIRPHCLPHSSQISMPHQWISIYYLAIMLHLPILYSIGLETNRSDEKRVRGRAERMFLLCGDYGQAITLMGSKSEPLH